VLPLVLAVVREALLGVALGFVPALVFLALQYAAELVDLQVGMGMGGWVDPAFRTQVSPLGNFQYLLAMVLFLGLDGHHLMLEALARSFQTVPLGTFSLSGAMARGIMHLFAQVGLFGVQMAAPLLAVLLITDLGLGMLGRAAPQLNLLIMSPSLKAVVAMLALAMSLPLLAVFVAHIVSGMRGELFSFLRAAVGR
jgi:flagellar biosynthetic protein FliR